MPPVSQSKARELLSILAALLCISLAGCGSQPQSQTQTEFQERRYPLKGRVVSIDKSQKRVIVDHEEIPNFMAAMTMPYPVVDEATLDRLEPGDQITGDVVVTGSGARLENVVIVGPSQETDSPSGSRLQQRQSGDQVPDFALVNQDGKRTRLRQYEDKALQSS